MNKEQLQLIREWIVAEIKQEIAYHEWNVHTLRNDDFDPDSKFEEIIKVFCTEEPETKLEYLCSVCGEEPQHGYGLNNGMCSDCEPEPEPEKMTQELTCRDCGETKPDVQLTTCPYDEDIHGIKTDILLCDACYHERSMDI